MQMEILYIYSVLSRWRLSVDKNSTVLSLCECVSTCNKGKVPVPFLTEHHTMKAYLGSGGIDPHIL
jgi:hypothetical protein